MRNAPVVRVMGIDLAAKAETTGAVVLEAVDETH